MYLLVQEDAKGMELGEPRTFGTKEQALRYDETRADQPLPKGHAIVLYYCREESMLREGA